MNIIEAIKSGKRFKRPGYGWYCNPSSSSFAFDALLETDWEVETEKITISKSDFESAYTDWLKTIPFKTDQLWDLLKAKDSK